MVWEGMKANPTSLVAAIEAETARELIAEKTNQLVNLAWKMSNKLGSEETLPEMRVEAWQSLNEGADPTSSEPTRSQARKIADFLESLNEED